MLQRIQKILASAGIASRRKSEGIIAAGRVTVNGKVAVIGQSADPDVDVICVDGNKIRSKGKVYIAVYKPKGYVSTVSDKFASRKVVDLVPVKGLFPVGRLDKDAEGLMILTNDGDFANRVMHPRYDVEKAYVVRLERPLDFADVDRLRRGLVVDGRKVFARVKVLGERKVEIAVHEGRHKIVKRLFRGLGNYVAGLTRTRIGMLSLDGLERGGFRHLSGREVDGLQELQKGV